NWLSGADIRNLLDLAGFEVLKTHQIVLLPKYVPLLSNFLNRFCARLPYLFPPLSIFLNRFCAPLPFLHKLCMTQVVVARMLPPAVPKEELSVSVIIPCKDEKGNVEDAVRRVPQLGGETEIIFCDDQSTDGTAEEVLRVASHYPERHIRLENGPGICKSKNVWPGLNE